MEFVLHSMYVVAIKDSPGDWWVDLGPMEVSMIGFWNLIIVWLKVTFTLPPSLFSFELQLIRWSGGNIVVDTMEVFQVGQFNGWYQSTREHGQMYGE